MFSTRMKDSPYKKRYSTLEESSRVKVKGPEMAFLGNPEFGENFLQYIGEVRRRL